MKDLCGPSGILPESFNGNYGSILLPKHKENEMSMHEDKPYIELLVSEFGKAAQKEYDAYGSLCHRRGNLLAFEMGGGYPYTSHKKLLEQIEAETSYFEQRREKVNDLYSELCRIAGKELNVLWLLDYAAALISLEWEMQLLDVLKSHKKYYNIDRRLAQNKRDFDKYDAEADEYYELLFGTPEA